VLSARFAVSVQISPDVHSRSPHANVAPASHDAWHVQAPVCGSHCAVQRQFIGHPQPPGGPLHGGGGGSTPEDDPPLDEAPLDELDELLDELLELPPEEGPVSGATAPPHATTTTATTASATRKVGMPPR
jgi:hypothetical protein